MKFLNNLNTGAGIDAGIKWVRSTGKKFDGIVHQLAVAIIVHAKEHGDCSRALRLVEAMPASARRAALIRWFAAFSPIKVTFTKEAKNRKVGLNKPNSKHYNDFNIDGARVNPYYEWDKSEDNALAALLTTADFNSKIPSMADFIQKKLDDGKVAPADKTSATAKVAALRQAAVAVA